MHLPAEQDTPYKRASIAELTDEQLQERMDALRERRLRAYSIYQAGLEAKQRAKDEKALASFDKTLEQCQKLFESIDKNLDKLEKKVLDIQALRLIMGDNITNG